MLVVSVLLLQCALLTLSSARENLLLPFPGINEAMGVGLLHEDLFTSLQSRNMQQLLNNYLHNHKENHWNHVIYSYFTPTEHIMMSVQDPHVLPLYLYRAPRREEVNLHVPLEFTLTAMSVSNVVRSRIRLPNRDPLSDEPITIDVRMDVKIQLALEDLNSAYQLTSKNCSLTPEAVWIQSSLMPPESELLPFSDDLRKEMNRSLREAIAYSVEITVCPLINKWLYNMDQRLANELIECGL